MNSVTLRAIRINLGLTIEKASELIGISKDSLSHYERGINSPNVFVLKNIEKAYGIKIFTDTVNFDV